MKALPRAPCETSVPSVVMLVALTSVHHFLSLLIHFNRVCLKRRSIHRHRNLLQPGPSRRVAEPPPLLGHKVHKKHLPIHFESQFISPSFWPPLPLPIRAST